MSAVCDNNDLIYVWESQVTVNDTNTTELILVSNFGIMYCVYHLHFYFVQSLQTGG